jgi:hypothetical protein
MMTAATASAQWTETSPESGDRKGNMDRPWYQRWWRNLNAGWARDIRRHRKMLEAEGLEAKRTKES